MQIRKMNRSDFDQVIDLLNEFSLESGLDLGLIEDDYKDYARKILLHCNLSGVNYLAQDGNKLVGMILSLKDHDIWLPKIIRLREVAWYVKPEYRSGSCGGKLFLEYCREAEKLQNQGQISSYAITKLHNSPDFDYARRGFKLVETTYMKGER